MQATKEKLTEDIVEEIEGLSKEKLKEILGFVSYVKAKEAIDPTQTYFWTKGWQKKARKIIGNRTAKGLLLLKELNSLLYN